MTNLSFEISTDDIITVFERHTGVKCSEELAEYISDKLDHEAIAMAAVKASTDMDKQTEAAYEEIEHQLDEIEEKFGW